MKKILIYFFILLPLLSFAQTIKGSIKDSNGNSIPYANILIKENENTSSIVEFTYARNGKFTINLKKKYQTILVEVTSQEYNNETFIIQKPDVKEIYEIDYVLQKQKVTELKEVVVVSEKKSYTIKEDTLTYNIEKYKDPTDKKVQDVLKRLPGIEVNEKSGEIKYKGKSVETVTLDGDNLFGYNYSLGTKNINIDMLEQVQAIDNYSENPLLKGIEGGEKVSLNLKLKKGKTDYSGNIDFGLGINNDLNLLNNSNANILGISKNYKSFGIISYNNIGVNHSPFDYFSSNKSIEQQKEKDASTHKIIPEVLFNNGIDDDRANINNMFFSNYNNIFKVNNRFSVKTNLYYINDNIKLNQLNTTENKIENQTFITSDDFNTKKKPQFYRGDIELKYNTSKNSLLEYKTKFSYENIKSYSSVTANEINSFKSNLKSESIFFNQKILYTNKLNDSKALQIQVSHAYNNIPQYLQINNKINSFTEEQTSSFKKNFLDAIVILLGNKSKNKYSFSTGATYENTTYNSINNLNPTEIKFNVPNYFKKSIYAFGSTNYNLKNWSIIPSFSLKYLNQEIDENQSLNNKSKSDVLFEPSFSIRYKINNKSFISSKASLTQTPFSEEYIFRNPITTNNRIKITNTPTLEILKAEVYNLNYYNNNMFKQFFISIGISYQKNNGNYFSNFIINENETILNNFYLDEKNDNLNLNLSTEKFISKLSTTFKLTSTVSKSNYKNIVNTSELRNNRSNNISNELTIKTAFNTKINFENQSNYIYSQNNSEKTGTINNMTFTNSLKIKYKHSSSVFSVITGDYYIPNTENSNNDYLFLDFSVIYKPKDKKYEFNIIGKNLLNNSIFSQIQTSDFSKSTLQNNLISRYIFVNFTYNL
ncbi:hypothetical protein BXU11_05895 [Flavobacterium sp. LM5]|uniref:carboxypeptidase-like regulatory domain-containing protein n=1 Tax=Flavobacterium sp. LM5 TaxID=1938610 RepID=UPI0009935DF8|nr:carboxypeptidase-like regulatory domain-containing protein [Flavobacterium sp. LM5]OOV29420.1 hypothetical protein BXU11_05895 [Flavobacterium sp. LM5]